MQVPALLSLGVLLASFQRVQGHGYIVDPAAQWAQGYPSNGYGSTVNSTVFGPMDNSVYGYGPEGAVKYFETLFPDSGYASLWDLIKANQVLYSDDIDAECGLTIYDDAKRSALPASKFTYSGFTHAGPCEFWCDDNKVAFDNDCQSTYADGTVPFEAAQCEGANRLAVYWIGVHGDPWQVYSDCVWLEGGSGSGGSSTTTTSAPATTTATTTTAPAATTAASSSASVGGDADTDDDATTTTDAPEATEAPATETEAPAATSAPAATTSAPAATEKCTASSRRRRS